MRTQKRRAAVHDRAARPERQHAPAKGDMPPLYRRWRAAWTAAGVLYALSALALVLLPAGYSWRSIAATATVSNVAGEALTGGAAGRGTPFLWLAEFLYSVGIRPKRAAWAPSGVDYGNTRMTAAARGNPVYMAWQYRPKKLSAIPPGINTLAPTWFYVEDDGGRAVVNDLAHLLDGKVASWDPSQYIQTAHSGGAKVWASVCCLSEPDLAKQLVTDDGRKSEFISRIAGWVREFGLDGINFDFEKMDPADAEKFTSLVSDCKKALPAGSTVSVCVTVPLDNPDPGNWWQCYDREGLGRAADYVAVMAYDNPDMEPVAAIDWVDRKMRQMLELVPQEKILMGVPFYGVDFKFDVPAGEKLKEMPAFEHSGSRGTITPASVKALLETDAYPSGKTKVSYWIDKGVWSDEEGVEEYSFVDSDGKLHLVYCEDEESLRLKGMLLAFNRLGGAAVWRLEFGSDPLWSSLYSGMTGTVNP